MVRMIPFYSAAFAAINKRRLFLHPCRVKRPKLLSQHVWRIYFLGPHDISHKCSPTSHALMGTDTGISRGGGTKAIQGGDEGEVGQRPEHGLDGIGGRHLKSLGHPKRGAGSQGVHTGTTSCSRSGSGGLCLPKGHVGKPQLDLHLSDGTLWTDFGWWRYRR